MRIAFLAPLLLVTACTEEPTPAQAEKALKNAVAADAEVEVKAKAKSIEQAADAAAKLIEEEANEEIEAIRAPQNAE
jgi:hypothetical protein